MLSRTWTSDLVARSIGHEVETCDQDDVEILIEGDNPVTLAIAETPLSMRQEEKSVEGHTGRAVGQDHELLVENPVLRNP